MRRGFAAVVVTFAAGCATGCAPAMIPGTSIQDSDENRQVLSFLDKYQVAVESRAADGVLQLCAKDYFEDNGNNDANDDYGIDGLKQRLTDHFARTKEVDIQIFVQRIDRTDPKQILVDYRFNSRALVGFPSGDKWLTSTEVNEMTLRPREGGGFEIVSGL